MFDKAQLTIRVALAAAIAGLSIGCGASGLPGVRYHNQPIIWQVNDTQPMPKPKEREYLLVTANLHDLFRLPALDSLSVSEPTHAANVNALDEVPNSTWFQNRHELSPEDVARGPNLHGGPDESAPWKVLQTKAGGQQLGFLIEDAREQRFILKFDLPGEPEADTGADVVVQRLLWAVGYHVPEDSVVTFTRDNLVLAPDATRKLASGEKVPLTDTELDEMLATLEKMPDGIHWRGLTSKFLSGVPVGGYPMQGVREDDRNDRVPHEDRRDVRGQRVFFSWLGHTDVKEDNTLDMWIESEETPGQGHLMHYLVDFGKGLGGKGYGGKTPEDSWTHQFDYPYGTASLLTFGLWTRPWEGIPHSELRGVGRYEAEHYRPDRYRSSRPYVPFFRTGRLDSFWAAKIMMRLSPAHIAAAVSTGKYTEPATEAYLVEAIIARQRKSAAHWFAEVNPLDEFEITERGDVFDVCMRDLALKYELLPPATHTLYEVSIHDFDGKRIANDKTYRPRSEGRVCVYGVSPASKEANYTILRYITRRNDEPLPATTLHIARDPASGTLRIIGLHRR